MPASILPPKDLERVRNARRPELGEFGAEAMLTISPRPEDICIVVAGGPGTHSTYAPSFGMIRAVTRVVGQ